MRIYGIFHHLTLHGHYENIFTAVAQSFIIFSATFVIILCLTWFIYYLSRVMTLNKKIHYLKKQIDERCRDELTNARVDYLKSLLLVVILVFEVIPLIVLPNMYLLFFQINKQHKIHNCSFDKFIEFSYNTPGYRVFTTLCLSSFIISLSLINILTSFLANAYSEKRAITLTNREKYIFVWFTIQLIVAWVCIGSWRSYIVVSPVIFVVLVTVHFYLYYKHGRKLYLQLRRRRLDFWYEDKESFKKLDKMCHHYKKSSILYISCISLLCLALMCFLVEELLDVLIRGSCVLSVFFHSNLIYTQQFYLQHREAVDIFFRVFGVVSTFLSFLATSFHFFLHFSILYQAIVRFLNRRRAMKNYKFQTRSAIFQPLIGNK